MADIENNPTAPEIPIAPPAPGGQPQGSPPAAALVVTGDVTDERQLALDRRAAELERREQLARDVENNVSERERKIQEREEALRAAPPVPKFKRKRNWSDPVNAPEEIE